MISQSRFEERYKQQTSVAQKVYDATPMTEAWTAQSITAELQRVGVHREFKVVLGCLNTLIEAGLVFEAKKNMFQREPIRAVIKVEKKEPEVAFTQNDMQATQHKDDPIQKLGHLAERLVAISTMVKDLAEDINEAALEAQAKMEEHGESAKTLAQLQTLLGGLAKPKVGA